LLASSHNVTCNEQAHCGHCADAWLCCHLGCVTCRRHCLRCSTSGFMFLACRLWALCAESIWGVCCIRWHGAVAAVLYSCCVLGCVLCKLAQRWCVRSRHLAIALRVAVHLHLHCTTDQTRQSLGCRHHFFSLAYSQLCTAAPATAVAVLVQPLPGSSSCVLTLALLLFIIGTVHRPCDRHWLVEWHTLSATCVGSSLGHASSQASLDLLKPCSVVF
jgi:hypothetical protein